MANPTLQELARNRQVTGIRWVQDVIRITVPKTGKLHCEITDALGLTDDEYTLEDIHTALCHEGFSETPMLSTATHEVWDCMC